MREKFKVDARVQFISGFRPPTGFFRIVRLLPPIEGEPCYRVKGDHEAFERVARESELRGA